MRENKIGIMTFLSNNYGTCLQAFALQEAIVECGYQVEIIDFKRALPEKKISFFKKLLIILKRYSILKMKNYFLNRQMDIESARKFEDFRRSRLNLSKDSYSSAEQMRPLDNAYDLCVAGSDMIWSEEYIEYMDVYFLRWCSKEKRVAYAPSFGSSDVSNVNISRYRDYISEFSCISCREKSGVELIKRICNIDVALVCDPTLLFNKEQWKTRFQIRKNHENYVLVNCFGGIPSEFSDSLQDLSEKIGGNIRYLNSGIREYENERKYGGSGYGPEEFIELTANASFIVVNGYHGLLFSLIFEKPFVLLHREEGEYWGIHEERMKDLLKELDIEERYIKSNAKIKNDFLTLDYTEISSKIQKLRKKSWSYLEQSLRRI